MKATKQAKVAKPAIVIDMTTGEVVAPKLTDALRAMGAEHGREAVDSVERAASALLGMDEVCALAQGSPEGFRSVRAAWCEGYIEATGCTDKTAWNRFALVYKASGLIKPRSAEAQRKAASRSARGPKAPKKGADAAAETKARIVLSAHEAHVVALMRAKKWGELSSFLADLASLEKANAPRVKGEVVAAA